MFNPSCCFVFIWGNWQVEGFLYLGAHGRDWERGIEACLHRLPPPGPYSGACCQRFAPPGSAWVTIGSSLQGGLGVFVQLMPILILILVSALSQLMVSSPPYSLSLRP